MLSLSRRLSWRYLFSSRQRFVPLLAFVTLGSIALGVWSLIVVLSVMQGFQKELHQRWIGLNAHVTVSTLPLEQKSSKEFIETVRKLPEVSEVSAYVEGEVIVRRPAEEGEAPVAMAAKLKGFDILGPEFLERLHPEPSDASSFSLMIGEELASSLGVLPEMEDSLTLIYPFGEIGPTGDWVPSQKTLPVSHLFKTGLYEWDAYNIIVPLAVGLDLLKEQKESGIKIRLKNISDLSKVEETLKKIAPPGTAVTTFAKENRRLFAALKLERLGMGFILFLFALIASLSVVGLLLMFIDAKRRDIALLRAIGLSPRGVQKIFLTLGGLLGLMGSTVGAGLAVLTLGVLHRFPVRLPATYYLDYLPAEIQWSSVAIILSLGICLALISAWYPVWVASKVEILPMLREE